MSILNNALSGASAAKIGLDVVSQNLSNAMTKGYSRQDIILTGEPSGDLASQSAGNGVRVASIRRYNDIYKDQTVWRSQTRLGSCDTKQPYLDQIENILGNTGTSLSDGLDQYYAALNAASAEPASLPLRGQIITAAHSLSERFNHLDSILQSQKATIREQKEAVTQHINALMQDIAKINTQVAMLKHQGANAAGSEDQLDQKVGELAKQLEIKVLPSPNGGYRISLPDGTPLVYEQTASTLQLQGQKDGSQKLLVTFSKQTFEERSLPTGGVLGALCQYEDGILNPVRNTVASMAMSLAKSTNDILSKGYDLKGHSGKALFQFNQDSEHNLLEVSDIKADQLGLSTQQNEAGNVGQLQKLIEDRNHTQNIIGLGQVSIADGYAQLVGKIASISQQNKVNLSTAKVLNNQANAQWNATSGVNKDEEAIHLMDFQRMYQANMKVIGVANQVFDSTLSLL